MELSESYRRLRVEHSAKLGTLWTRFEKMEVEGRDMRRLATQALQAEVKEALEQDAPEALQAQSHALSNGRRTLPTA